KRGTRKHHVFVDLDELALVDEESERLICSRVGYQLLARRRIERSRGDAFAKRVGGRAHRLRQRWTMRLARDSRANPGEIVPAKIDNQLTDDLGCELGKCGAKIA